MTTMAVQLKGVAKTYPHFKLGDLDLELPHGQIMGFIGPNGAGKSTTIRILMGLVHQDQGEVKVLGQAMPRGQIAAKRGIGFASEDMRLYGQAPLSWHMDFIKTNYPDWDKAYAAELLKRFDLKADQKLKGFSHGQRVKAILLLVLARRPRLLILDEPTTGLDPVARHEVLGELMEAMADEERTILFSSHNTQDVEQLSDTITFIDRGRIIDARDKETFLERWRRVRIELPVGAELPDLPEVVAVKMSGRLAVLTTNNFQPALTETCLKAGIQIQRIETMTLEEIFIANVALSRGVLK